MNVQNYERLLYRNDGAKKFFITPWAGLVIQNISNQGNLVKYSSLNKLKSENVPIWISLKLFLFREHNNFFTIFKCNQCECMDAIDSLTVDQNEQDLQRFKCLHSMISDIILRKLGAFNTVWNINTQDYQAGDECFEINTNDTINHATLVDNDVSFLAILNNKITGKMSILTTLI